MTQPQDPSQQPYPPYPGQPYPPPQGAPGWNQPGWQQPGQWGPNPYQAQPGWSGLAIASLVLSIVTIFGLGSALGIVFGLIGLSQTKDGAKRGRGLALAGLIVGVITLGLCIWFWVEVGTHHGHFCKSTDPNYCRDQGFGND